MATKICFTGDFKVTCEYGRSGTTWKSGRHQGIDLVGITNKKYIQYVMELLNVLDMIRVDLEIM